MKHFYIIASRTPWQILNQNIMKTRHNIAAIKYVSQLHFSSQTSSGQVYVWIFITQFTNLNYESWKSYALKIPCLSHETQTALFSFSNTKPRTIPTSAFTSHCQWLCTITYHKKKLDERIISNRMRRWEERACRLNTGNDRWKNFGLWTTFPSCNSFTIMIRLCAKDRGWLLGEHLG